MIDIHYNPDNGMYCLVNSITGYVLAKRNGYPKYYRSVAKACKGRDKRIRRFNRIVSNLSRRTA